MDAAELHRRAVEGWQAKVEGVAGAQWGESTPCADWDVRALVNHVVGEELWTVPLVEGATLEDVGDRFDGDVLGAQPLRAAREAARAAVDAMTAALGGGGTVLLSFGTVPIEEYAAQLTADHVVHGWDLAAATGQDRSIDPEVAQHVAAWFEEREELYRSAGAVGPRTAAADDPQSQLLAVFGRDPSW
jgi:uncharacterized protein (TIGR03086 family)